MPMQLISLMHKVTNHIWYGKSKLHFLLTPFAWIYWGALRFRDFIFKFHRSWVAPIPIVVVGNLTVGGVGKTPLVVAIANYYTNKGLKVGIVSRGYGAKGCKFPYKVNKDDCATKVGDEPLLLATLTNCPVMIAPKRVLAVKELIKNYNLDLIVSDDGLQHKALARQVEIVVIDGTRGFGNERLLPAGPLREPISRLNSVDFVVFNGLDDENIPKLLENTYNVVARRIAAKLRHCDPEHSEGAATSGLKIKGHWIASLSLATTKEHSILKDHGYILNLKIKSSYNMQFQVSSLKNIKSGEEVNFDVLKKCNFNAVAGIGNPERFFVNLRHLGLLNFKTFIFPDHYVYKKSDFSDICGPVIMTEKDAVKCISFALDDWYSLGINAVINDEFWNKLTKLLYPSNLKTHITSLRDA